MKFKVYSIQDTMIGFGMPFLKVNEEVAKRDYINFLKNEQNRKDMRLYRIGEFNDETGVIEPEVPVIVEGGYVDE